jgi:hypothetical protein
MDGTPFISFLGDTAPLLPRQLINHFDLKINYASFTGKSGHSFTGLTVWAVRRGPGQAPVRTPV